MHPGRKLRDLIASHGCVALPGAFNGLVARLCADAGFLAMYLSGGALSASKGVPDIGILSLDNFAGAIKEITTASSLPCLADADTGFGEIEMIPKTVYEYNYAGAAGLHIEDQSFPKRCGHLDGKTLISTEDFCQKIQRAVSTRDQISSGDFIICARTDAFAVEGLKSAITRASAYCEAGADMIFPEGLSSKEEFLEFAKAMKRLNGSAPGGGPYLLANMTEFGKSPLLSVEQLREIGYHCIIFPVSTLRIAMESTRLFLENLKETGAVNDSTLLKMLPRKNMYNILGYTPGREWTFPSTSNSSQFSDSK